MSGLAQEPLLSDLPATGIILLGYGHLIECQYTIRISKEHTGSSLMFAFLIKYNYCSTIRFTINQPKLPVITSIYLTQRHTIKIHNDKQCINYNFAL